MARYSDVVDARTSRAGFREALGGGEGVDAGDGGGDEERETRTDECGNAANCRSEGEPCAERRPEQSEQASAVLRRRDVGDRRLRDRHACSTGTVDDASEEQQPQQRTGQPG